MFGSMQYNIQCNKYNANLEGSREFLCLECLEKAKILDPVFRLYKLLIRSDEMNISQFLNLNFLQDLTLSAMGVAGPSIIWEGVDLTHTF